MTLFKTFNIPTIIKSIKLMGKKSKLFLTCIFIFCAVEIIGTVLNTAGIKGVITALGDSNYIHFWKSLFLIVLNNSIWWIYAPIATYLCDVASKGTMRDIKTNLCKHIISLPMKYHDTKANGELLSNVSNDTACLQGIYDWNFFQVLRSAIGGIGGIIIMAIIDWRFAIVVLTLGTISVFTTTHYGKKLEKIGAELQERLAKSSTDAYELVKAAKTIRLMNLKGIKTESFNTSTRLEADSKIIIGKISSKMNAIILGISSISYIAILFIGALFVYYKLSNWGTIIALTGLKYTADMLFSECGQFMAGMQTNVAGVKRLFEITYKPKEKILSDMSFAIKKLNEPLSIDDVSFSYDENTPVISNYNMTLENNKLTALVGESGSGKSTIMKLILGLYEPKDGSITFDGDEEVTLTNLRNKTAYVPQDAMLFRGSIYDNIGCGNEHSTKDDIIYAAKLAGANEFIVDLENGYDTVILDDGKSLSGGQKQRIAIARALVKNAPILLLDEITSALDKQTEYHILETIKNISKTKSILFITHRDDVIKWADKIFTIKKD
jgi:ATP-binding cassette subfamily B protein